MKRFLEICSALMADTSPETIPATPTARSNMMLKAIQWSLDKRIANEPTHSDEYQNIVDPNERALASYAHRITDRVFPLRGPVSIGRITAEMSSEDQRRLESDLVVFSCRVMEGSAIISGKVCAETNGDNTLRGGRIKLVPDKNSGNPLIPTLT